MYAAWSTEAAAKPTPKCDATQLVDWHIEVFGDVAYHRCRNEPTCKGDHHCRYCPHTWSEETK